MAQAILEHVNITVSEPKTIADLLCHLFDWSVRWHGNSKLGGITYHVGGDNSYLAIYSNGGRQESSDSYNTLGAMNHIGIVVEDINETEKRIRAAGYKTHSHDDYEPGLRFYFDGPDGIEIEIVSYQS